MRWLWLPMCMMLATADAQTFSWSQAAKPVKPVLRPVADPQPTAIPQRAAEPTPVVESTDPKPDEPDDEEPRETIGDKLRQKRLMDDIKQEIRGEFEELTNKLAEQIKQPAPAAEQLPPPPATNQPAKMPPPVRRAAPRSAAEWLDSVLEIDHGAPKLTRAMPKIKIRTFCPVWCPACPGVLKRMGEHPLYEFVPVKEESALVNKANGMYPAAEDPETGRVFWGPNFESWERLLKRMNYYREQVDIEDGGVPMLAMKPSMISSGMTIDGELLANIVSTLQTFKPRGSIAGDNKPCHWAKGWFSANVPADMALSWDTADGVTTFKLDPPPSAGVGVVQETIPGVSLSLDGIVLQGRFVPISVPVKR